MKILSDLKSIFKLTLNKSMAWLLSVMMIVGVISILPVEASATQSSSGGFNTGYTLTGDGFTDMVNIAMAQNEKTQAQIGYSESWCADFVSDCARLAGQESAIPFNGVVQSMYNAVIAAGGSVVGSAQAGDLVFFSNGSGYGHVGIALDGTRNISGNIWYNGNPPSKVCILNNSWEGYSSWTFVRPNYKKADTTAPTISDIYIHSQNSEGYTLHFIVHDDTALSYAIVYTQGSVPQTSEVMYISGTGWEFNYRVNFSDHGGVTSGYTNAIWVFDTAGNRGDSDWIYVNTDTEKPVISNLTVSQVTSKGYRVTCNVNDNVGVTSVKFPTWTDNNGQDDLIWHDGIIQGSEASFYIHTSNHNNEIGDYVTHVYAYDAVGNWSSVSTGIIYVSDDPKIVSSMIYEGHKYTVYNSGKTWTEAKEWCENNGGYLACITSQKEWEQVLKLLKEYNGVDSWLGAECTSGTWNWVSGEAWQNSEEWYPWGNDQPDFYNNNEFYLGTWGGNWINGYVWNDYSNPPLANEIGGFVFERPEHQYEEEVIEPTCTEKGYTLHNCIFCDDNYIDSYTDAAGHDYTTTIVNPSCNEDGYTLHTCSKCGDSYKDNITNMISHEFGDWTISGDTAKHKCKHCGAEETKPLASSISLEKASISIEKGKKTTLKAVITPENAYDKTVTWSSTNSSVATVSNGIVTAKSVGTAFIIAITSNGKSALCEVKVINKEVSNLTNTSWVNAEKVQIGDDIRVTGGAEGGSGGYTYAYYFKRSVNTKWNKIGTEFGTASYAITIPKAATDYDMKVVVKDSEGNTAEKIFKVTAVESLPLTNISLINTPAAISTGKTVTLAGRYVGGTKPVKYEFYFKRSANTKWNKLSYGNEKQTYAKFTPTKAAEYDLKAVAIDKDGTKSEKIYNITAN